MTNLPVRSAVLGTSALAALFLGLSFSASPTQAGAVVLRPTQIVRPTQLTSFNPSGCIHTGGVRANPCNIIFSSSNPGPILVTVTTPGGKGTLREGDLCGSRGIASVSSQGNNQYSVAAGSNTGICFVHFRYYNKSGKRTGAAVVRVNNTL